MTSNLGQQSLSNVSCLDFITIQSKRHIYAPNSVQLIGIHSTSTQFFLLHLTRLLEEDRSWTTRKIPKAPSFSNNCIRKLFRSDINMMNYTSMMNLLWKIISFSSWKLSKGKQGQLEMTNIYQWVLSHKILSAEFLLQLNQVDSSWRINWTHLDLTSCGIRTGR